MATATGHRQENKKIKIKVSQEVAPGKISKKRKSQRSPRFFNSLAFPIFK